MESLRGAVIPFTTLNSLRTRSKLGGSVFILYTVHRNFPENKIKEKKFNSSRALQGTSAPCQRNIGHILSLPSWHILSKTATFSTKVQYELNNHIRKQGLQCIGTPILWLDSKSLRESRKPHFLSSPATLPISIHIVKHQINSSSEPKRSG